MSETTDRAGFLAAHEEMMRGRWPEGLEARELTSAFGTTRVWVAGAAEAPPLVLFPAHQATTAAWGDLASALQGDRRAYAVDLMGDAGASVRGIPTDRDAGGPGRVDRLRARRSRPRSARNWRGIPTARGLR